MKNIKHSIKHSYEFDRKTPIGKIKKALINARKEDRIYLIARVVEILRYRGCYYIKLTDNERKRLAKALLMARFGKITHMPLMACLPRGYQILRLLTTIMAVAPDMQVHATKRDVKLINETAKEFGPEGSDLWSKQQLPSLKRSTKAIGLKVNSKTGFVRL